MYPQWSADIAGAGFVDVETFSYDVHVLFARSMAGPIRASVGVGANLPESAVAAFDEEHGAMPGA